MTIHACRENAILLFYMGSACKVWSMPHYVFTDYAGRVLGVAVNVEHPEARRIAHDLDVKRIEEDGYTLSYAPVDVTEVHAYAPKPYAVGDVVTGEVAMTLPKGSSIVCVGTAHVTTEPGRWALLRGVVGYVQPDLTEGPVQHDSRFRILHLGKVRL